MTVSVQRLVRCVSRPSYPLRRVTLTPLSCELHCTAKWSDVSARPPVRSTMPLIASCHGGLCDSGAGLTGGTDRRWVSGMGRHRHRMSSLQAGTTLVPARMPVTAPVSHEFKTLFCLTDDQCLRLLHYPSLAIVPPQTLLDTGLYLRERGVEKEQLLRLPWILLKDRGSIQMRLAVLLSGHTMFESAVHALAFCQYSMPKIRDFRTSFHGERLDLPHHRNRVYFMADKLKVTVPEMTEAVVCFRQFGSISLKHILNVVEELSNLDLPGQNILRDPWIFMENISLEKRSLQEFAVQYYRGNGAAAGPGPAGSYDLAACIIGEDSFLDLIANLRIQGNSVSLRKEKAVMDLLLQHGYTITDILHHARVLNYSLKRISERLSALQAAGLRKVPTACISYTQSRFETYFGISLRKIKN